MDDWLMLAALFLTLGLGLMLIIGACLPGNHPFSSTLVGTDGHVYLAQAGHYMPWLHRRRRDGTEMTICG
jgi:hypothetical protein